MSRIRIKSFKEEYLRQRAKMGFNRRELLRWLPLAAAPLWLPRGLKARRLPYGTNPRVEVFDFTGINSWLTPAEDFFVRNHFDTFVPASDVNNWKLSVTGLVEEPFEIRFEEVLKQPTRTLVAAMECTGNGQPQGGVSNASWTGFSLSRLLERAKVRPQAKWVRLIGADQGKETTEVSLKEPVPYWRSISLEKAMHPDTLLAYKMNDETLNADHGFPLRAVVPGWYGPDWMKWLVRIEVREAEDDGVFMANFWQSKTALLFGYVDVKPITTMNVKSMICRPWSNERLAPGTHKLIGVAWSGLSRIAKVEVSTDAGQSWAAATITSENHPYAWVLWEYLWNVPSPGQYTVEVRASDEMGRTQPEKRDPLRLDPYELNWYHALRYQVGSDAPPEE